MFNLGTIKKVGDIVKLEFLTLTFTNSPLYKEHCKTLIGIVMMEEINVRGESVNVVY